MAQRPAPVRKSAPARAARPRRRARRADPLEHPTLHFLDMGEDRYGDCVVVRAGTRTILVDGAHPRDLQGQRGTASVPEQLTQVFGHGPPFDVTLVVVTHGHNDHIGCLPELIAQGIVRPRFALVSDPAHCFPPGARDLIAPDPALDSVANETVRRVLTGLAEEDHSDLPEAEVELFLDRTLKLGDRYRAMIEHLEQDPGVDLVRWGTTPVEALLPIYQALEGTGFDVIAPGLPHLEMCRDQIVRYASDSADTIRDALDDFGADAFASPDRLAAQLYRGHAGDAVLDILIDRAGQGSALNCQSIMLAFGHGPNKALLTGDMQFAEPEVPGLEPHIEHLLAEVAAAGPYRCVKLPHHSSYNGIGPELWERLGKPQLLVHSGGSDDPSHPDPNVLRAYQALDDQIVLLRTDRNGLISVDLSDNPQPVSISRGSPDDFSVNPRRRRQGGDPEPTPARPAAAPAAMAPAPAPAPAQSATPDEPVEIVLVRLPIDHELRIGNTTLEVRRRKMQASGEPGTAKPAGRADPRGPLAGGRTLDKLLFVTASGGLARNIGAEEAAGVVAMIEGNSNLVDVEGASDPHGQVRGALARDAYRGVVLVGGYDILPAQRVDVLDAELKQRVLPEDIAYDPDDFIVWSDDVWGDVNGDGLADLPVSRIPDGRSAELVTAALTADGRAADGAFGIRNEARPFAKAIYSLIATDEPLVCAPLHVSQITRDAPARRNVYFMLHGDDRDASRFWGDDPRTRRVVEAINVSALPTAGLDIVFAGCCWGALSVLQRANRTETTVAPRAPEESMALACLRAGARAFVGCTGVHYSPGEEGGFFGAPMHDAFWREILAGRPPAEALFRARAIYLRDMPHHRTVPLEVAIERKIYKQFTCLGLGW